jgi:polysaccharide biosynthesis/export protein
MNSRVSPYLFAACLAAFSSVFSPVWARDEAASSSQDDRRGAVRESTTKSDYVLQPQDLIRVQVFGVEDINKQGDGLSLSQDSSVTLPLIGTISLKGKTVRQAEEMIRALYDKDYIVNPQVTLTVVKYSERTVNVIGSVTNQGRIPFPQERGLSIVDAISLAGGPTRYANMKQVRLTRKNADGENVNTTIDVDAMTKKGGAETVTLQPDDIVFVPERSI